VFVAVDLAGDVKKALTSEYAHDGGSENKTNPGRVYFV
jgi:hypothetical protein